MSRRRVVVSELRRCVDCGRVLKDYQDLLCYDCVKHKLEAILRVASRDPDLIMELKGRYESEEGLDLLSN